MLWISEQSIEDIKLGITIMDMVTYNSQGEAPESILEPTSIPEYTDNPSNEYSREHLEAWLDRAQIAGRLGSSMIPPSFGPCR